MEKQLIISIGREYGSGGHEVAEKLAECFQLPLYDSDMLRDISIQKNIDLEYLKRYDEKPKNIVMSRRVNGMSNSPEENVAMLQFDYLRSLAEEGKSFVVVGRCAEEVLKSYDALVSVFILGDTDKKIARTAEIYQVSLEKAEALNLHNDRVRKLYHNHYCDGKWGDSRNYQLCINSSRIGIDETVAVIERYIQAKMEK